MTRDGAVKQWRLHQHDVVVTDVYVILKAPNVAAISANCEVFSVHSLPILQSQSHILNTLNIQGLQMKSVEFSKITWFPFTIMLATIVQVK